jgi:hypothetical protein
MKKNNKSLSVGSGIIDIYEQIPRGKEYTPAITIQDVPSLGRSSRIYGIKTDRQHDFLSDNERNFYYYLVFSSEVIDIREQFPLQLDITLLIAEELGLKHPIHPKTKEPIHMTSDFCVTVNEDGKMKDKICTIKSKDDLVDRRVVEKFEIEQTYWRQLGIDWSMVTDVEINKTVALNIADVMHYYSLNMLESFNKIDEEEMNDIIIAFIQRLIDSNKSVREVSSVFERDLHLVKGAGISLFKHIIARKYINVNLLGQLNMDNIIRIDLTRETINLGEVVS